MDYSAAFSYYGGKSKIAHLYPAPSHPLVIEPFCGAAAYSLRWGWCRQIHINDLNTDTYDVWQWIASPEALADIEKYVPDMADIHIGMRVSEFADPNMARGLRLILQASCNGGTFGQSGQWDQITKIGIKVYSLLKDKLRWLCPYVRSRGWTITNLDYRQLPNVEATWFIDPPYNNKAGSFY